MKQKTKNDIGNARNKQFRNVIRDFRRMGFEVKDIGGHSFCFNEMITITPANKAFNDLINKKLGNIQDKTFDQFLREYFNLI